MSERKRELAIIVSPELSVVLVNMQTPPDTPVKIIHEWLRVKKYLREELKNGNVPF